MASLAAAHAARAGIRGAPLALVVALTVTNNSHRGFFVYALMFLALDMVLARDWRSGARAAIAAVAAILVSLPRTWDLWCTVLLHREQRRADSDPVCVGGISPQGVLQRGAALAARSVAERLQRARTHLHPVLAVVAWKAPRRIRFYAVVTLAVLALVRLNHSVFGYAFIRPLHMLPVLLGPPLSWFMLRLSGSRLLASAFAIWLALFMQVWLVRVPHVRSVSEFDPHLISRVAGDCGPPRRHRERVSSRCRHRSGSRLTTDAVRRPLRGTSTRGDRSQSLRGHVGRLAMDCVPQ